MTDENFKITLPKSQNIIQIQLKDITVPPLLLNARADTLSALDASLKSGNIADMDSNLAILYNTLKSDGIFVPIRVYTTPKNPNSYMLTEGLLRLKIFENLYPKSRLPAIVDAYDKDILHRAFIGNMAREDYTLPELAQWINFLLSGDNSDENRHSIHTKYHIPRSRITCALFSTSESYKKLLSKYPETSITVLERIYTALKPTSDYMRHPPARSFVLDHLKNLEGSRVSKGLLDSLLSDALDLVKKSGSDSSNASGYGTTKSNDTSTPQVTTEEPEAPPIFYRERTLPSTLYNALSSKIQNAIKNAIIQPDDISVTVRIRKEALATLLDKDVDRVNSLDIEEWLK